MVGHVSLPAGTLHDVDGTCCAANESRVVLVKPGDLLVLGNVGEMTSESLAAMQDAINALKEKLRLAGVVLFESDVDLAAVPCG